MPPVPVPTAILSARGSWRAKTRAGEPRPRVQKPSCPALLQGEGKAEWNRQVRELHRLGLIARMDRGLLVLWCEAWANYLELTEAIRAAGGVKQGAALQLFWARKSAGETLLKVSALFGFSPSARSRLHVVEQTNVEDDPIEKLLSHRPS